MPSGASIQGNSPYLHGESAMAGIQPQPVQRSILLWTGPPADAWGSSVCRSTLRCIPGASCDACSHRPAPHPEMGGPPWLDPTHNEGKGAAQASVFGSPDPASGGDYG